ncbi:MAG: transposase family protein [Bdellovibrionales bacterium]|nr:transposase family protein [Bdellovibrionales bacterium]
MTKEKRSYEVPFAGGLWHLDFHHARRMVLMPNGQRVVPICLAIMDDCTRLCCHIQWFIHETAETLSHGFMQALLKRGLPRALMSDNGAAMVSAEFTQGLMRLSIQHDLTMPYSPIKMVNRSHFGAILRGGSWPCLKMIRR